ncbi:phosphodiester glycosidase family protein [Anaerocolumna sp. AGMB13025]|uniref:phosphodiester glycosidase family protein n=1 Tax=Anaerocolumna sp. AGMB13025 TaxID=3039116 RepID=UPI00241DB349|nr:phosphodiester glycosidase family protein [Anaerocolumna sp. AGMB13025]WFR58504.1 phosphodiester glycosidase family protein [Anaerocolumna sp. AGMB13025]
MKDKKKLMPVWLLIAIDLVIIAAYVGGFYRFYYLTSRQLESSGVKTNTQDQAYLPPKSTTGTTDTAGNDTGESTVTVDTTDTTEELRTKFAAHFTDTVVSNENSYTSKDISIEVNQYTEGSGGNIVTYYVADIYVADIKCLQSGFADNTFGIGYAQDLINMDESLNAILAINGDYYGNGSQGVVIRNGEVYRKENGNSDVCVLYYDGTMKTYTAADFNTEEAIADNAYQAWSFGPRLLDDNGNSMESFTTNSHIKEENPRTAIGYYEPGHYAFVVVDGRQSGYSYGLTLTQFSKLFEKLGCKAAYNLDGGKSSEMTFNDALVNRPAGGGREVSDCIILKEVR